MKQSTLDVKGTKAQATIQDAWEAGLFVRATDTSVTIAGPSNELRAFIAAQAKVSEQKEEAAEYPDDGE